MSNELAVTNSVIHSYDDAERAARAMAASGFFPDSKLAAQAIVKIMAGHELGFGPFASMTGVSIIQGKPAVGANLQAAAVKRTGKYNFSIIQHTEKVCELEFKERTDGKWQSVGKSIFTWDDAGKAGLSAKDNWKKFPRNMLFARALSNGVKWYAPDIFNGATVYTPDELGASEDEDGNVIEVAADKYAVALGAYSQLVDRAEAVGITTEPLPDNITIDELREIYGELLSFVNDATKQENK